jgi:hypothetical protein
MSRKIDHKIWDSPLHFFIVQCDTMITVERNLGYWRLLIETFMGEMLCFAHAIDFE